MDGKAYEKYKRGVNINNEMKAKIRKSITPQFAK